MGKDGRPEIADHGFHVAAPEQVLNYKDSMCIVQCLLGPDFIVDFFLYPHEEPEKVKVTCIC